MIRHHAKERRGIIAIIVIIGIVAVLIGLVLPSIQKLRDEVARINGIEYNLTNTKSSHNLLRDLKANTSLKEEHIIDDLKTLKALAGRGFIVSYMTVGESQTVWFKIACFATVQERTKLEGERDPKLPKLKEVDIHPQIKVTLTTSGDNGLSIQAHQSDLQLMDGRKEISWTWTVTAFKDGKYPLHLKATSITSFKSAAGVKESEEGADFYTETVTVSVSWGEWFREIWEKFAWWIIGVGGLIATTLIGLIVKYLFDKWKKQKEKDQELNEPQDETGDV